MAAESQPMGHPERDLHEARRIVIAGLEGCDARIYLFGSHAHGAPRRYSDIDIGILPRTPLPPGLLAAIRESLEDSDIVYSVDLVDLSEASEAFRARVMREGIPWND